jgi:bifunctional UDP-N-acetylglucosamine pyrophosphorylase/glucosamine-1-phosphate N-acetyltransferase
MIERPVVIVTGIEGNRGFSSVTAKLFEPVLGRPLASFALEAVGALKPEALVLVLRDEDRAPREEWEGLARSAGLQVPLFIQFEPGRPRRTGAAPYPALRAAASVLAEYPGRDIVVVPAERPLLRARTLRTFLGLHVRKGCALTFLSAEGDVGQAGVLAFRSSDVFPLVRSLPPSAAEAWPGSLLRALARGGRKAGLYECPEPGELLVVRDRADLSDAAAALRDRKNLSLSRHGVTIMDPRSAWLDWDVKAGRGTVLYPFVFVEGASRIGKDCRLYPHVHLKNTLVADRVHVLSSTVVEDSVLESDTRVGPFTRLRPRTRVRAGSKVGNFVEMKNTDFGPRSKAMHLSYLGDSRVEKAVNIGAGTITCNYDGVTKSPTLIGAGAFIGSGTELVAPVKVGRKAYVAAGSTITKDVGPGCLAVARARQIEKPGWVLEKVKGRRPRRG